jgi:ribosomal protein L37AE/L43A
MALDEDFDYFHKYRRLARRGLVKPLTCPKCGTEYITRLGPQDLLLLNCTTCDVDVKPGAHTMNNVRAVVGEHFA